jgi:VWFA-related protein
MRIAIGFLLALAVSATAAEAYKRGEKKKIEALPFQFQQWLAEVEPLIHPEELEIFLQLEQDYQREAFIEKFWRSRDPHPETRQNEFKGVYYARREDAATRFPAGDDRILIYVLNGDPHGFYQTQCNGVLWPIEIWEYNYSEQLRAGFQVVFYQPTSTGPFKQWSRIDGEEDLLVFDPTLSGSRTGGFREAVSRSCRDADTILATISRAASDSRVERLAGTKPPPYDEEWLQTFQHFSTDVPADARLLEAELGFAFPGSYQSRTVVQGELTVPVAAAGKAELAGQETYNFLLTGEVLRRDELFETFRYRFDFPAAEVVADDVPMLFERYLRPGDYSVVLRVEDLNSERQARITEVLTVPRLDDAGEPDAVLEEAAEAAVEAVGPAVELLPPGEEILTGAVRFEARVRGEAVARVAFSLNDKALLTKTRPPFSIEVNLGTVPRTHVVRAVAYDAGGAEIAADQLTVNAGEHHFEIELVEPRANAALSQVTRARAEVTVPDGAALDRVELYLGETRLATLYSPPYVQPLRLGDPEAVVFVRAVAYLADGNATEDLVFVNAPGYVEETEVRMVELYTTVVDGQGRPRSDLSRGDFTVLENGDEQQVLRFERLDDLPIYATLLIDTSASMEQNLEAVNQAALDFLESTIHPKDRAAIVTFSEQPRLAAKFTSDMAELARALAGFRAEQSTALYDSVIFSLYYMKGIKGQRVLLILSDGLDRRSEHTFEQALELAQRENVTVYTIGIDLKKASAGRRRLTQLAEETGGSSFFIDGVGELASIYLQIEQEIRSQYLIAYQSSHGAEDDGFRLVDVKVRSGGEARTLRGYYP